MVMKGSVLHRTPLLDLGAEDLSDSERSHASRNLRTGTSRRCVASGRTRRMCVTLGTPMVGIMATTTRRAAGAAADPGNFHTGVSALRMWPGVNSQLGGIGSIEQTDVRRSECEGRYL